MVRISTFPLAISQLIHFSPSSPCRLGDEFSEVTLTEAAAEAEPILKSEASQPARTHKRNASASNVASPASSLLPVCDPDLILIFIDRHIYRLDESEMRFA